MSTICDYFYFSVLLPAKLSGSACLPPAYLLFSFCILKFASSLKHYYRSLVLAIESCNDVCLHVTPALPTAFLKKNVAIKELIQYIRKHLDEKTFGFFGVSWPDSCMYIAILLQLQYNKVFCEYQAK